MLVVNINISTTKIDLYEKESVALHLLVVQQPLAGWRHSERLARPR